MSKIRLILNSQVILFGTNPETVKQLKEKFSFPNPAYTEARKRGRWTGNIDKVLYFYKEEQGLLKFPRGALRQILDIIGKNIIFEDKRRVLPPVNFQFKGELRPYQKIAVAEMLKKDFGVLSALCGAGKTIICLSIIAARKQPTLIVVHSVELLEQWRDRIKSFLHVDAGLIGNGKYDVQPITVGITNSVRKHLADLPKYFGQIISDEVHRCPSTMLSEVVRAFDCRFALGCSGSPYRRDGLTNLIHWFVGPLIHKIDPVELQDTGSVLIPEIRTRETGFNYQKLLSLIVVDEDRNNMIVQDVLFEVRHHSGTVLVVSDRIEHCEILLNSLRLAPGIGYDVKMLTGQLKSQERTSLVEDIRAGKVKIVIATVQLIGEGVDFPCLSSLFLATPIRFEGRVVQTIGRILRPLDGKTPRVFDYCDPVGPLFASAKARQKTYREMNWIK